ncbi:MAG: hypothetical protein K2X38_18205, partial [Gemmataceae bacterium]|nr:hypothetical protein [Gemmataceae bacterium]
MMIGDRRMKNKREIVVFIPASSFSDLRSTAFLCVLGASVVCAVQRRWFSVGANPTRQLGHS